MKRILAFILVTPLALLAQNSDVSADILDGLGRATHSEREAFTRKMIDSPPEIFPFLAEAALSDDPEIRVRALDALDGHAQRPDPEHILGAEAMYRRLVDTGPPMVRRLAARRLKESRTEGLSYLKGLGASYTSSPPTLRLQKAWRGSSNDVVYICRMVDLEKLYLNHETIGDESTGWLRYLEGLTYLNLKDSRIGDAGLHFLSGLTNLTSLSLENTEVTADGLSSLKDMKNLQYLYLGGCDVEGGDLRLLQKLHKLQRLSFARAPISDEAIRHLPGLPAVTNLGLDSTMVTSDCLDHILLMPTLETLYLSHTKVELESVKRLKALPALKKLYLHGLVPNDEAYNDLKKALPGVTIRK